MPSTLIILTAIASLAGFLLNGTGLYLVLSRGRKTYHYLFAGVLFTCAVWDLGVFLMMVRNEHVTELMVYGNIILAVCGFLPALIYTFTLDYLGKSKKWTTITIWVICALVTLAYTTGVGGKIEGV